MADGKKDLGLLDEVSFKKARMLAESQASAEKAYNDPAGTIFSSGTALDGRNPARDAQMSSLDPFKILKGQDDKTNEYFRNQTMSGTLSKTQPILDAPQAASPGQYQIQTIDRTPQIQESPFYRQRQDEAQRRAMMRSQGAGPSMAGMVTQQSRDAALLGQMGAAQGARGGYSPLNALAAQRAAAPAFSELARVGATQTAQEIGAGQTAYAGISQQQRAQDLALAQQNAALDQSIKLANANAEQQRYMAMGAADQRIGLANAGTSNDITMANAGAQLRDMQLHAQAARDQASLLGGTTSTAMGLLIGEQQRQQQIKAAEEQLRYKLGVAQRNKEIADEWLPAQLISGGMRAVPVYGQIGSGIMDAGITYGKSQQS